MRSRTKGVVLGALATMALVVGTSPLLVGAASPLGEFGTAATAGVTPGMPADSELRAVTMGPDGLMWFIDDSSVNRINEDGSVTSFDAEPTFGPGPSLQAIVAGPDGNLWFSKFNPPGQVGRITPDGTMTVMTAFPSGNLQDIILGPDGNLWYTRPFLNPGVIGRITPGGVVTEFVPPNAGASPRFMAVGSDGNIWYTDDSDDQTVGMILRTTTSGVITPVAESGVTPGFGPGFLPYRITLGPDGNIWAVLAAGPDFAVARVTPAGEVTEFADPDTGSLYDIVSACGSLFISQQVAEESTAAVWQLTTAGAFTEYTDGLPDVSPQGMAFGLEDDLWIAAFGEPGAILTMGAGCGAPPPSSSTTTATNASVTPRFTG